MEVMAWVEDCPQCLMNMEEHGSECLRHRGTKDAS